MAHSKFVDFLATADAGYIMAKSGLIPDEWQQRVCDLCAPRILLLICRQAGKSSTAAAMGLNRMIRWPDTPVIIVTPTERQSAETLRKAKHYLSCLDLAVRVDRESVTAIELTNGSRMLALPGKPTTIRSYANSRLIILDEAAYIPNADDVYTAVEPMLAADGQMMLMSTPFGARGLFHQAWQTESDWYKLCITAEQVPRRYPADVLAAKRADPLISPRQFAQEYLCEFVDTVDSVFAIDDINYTITDQIQPLYAVPQ